MVTARLWVFVLLLAAASAPASAQAPDQDQASAPLRAALLDGEREKKATETSPPLRGTIERALSVYDKKGGGVPFVFQPWHGFRLAASGFPAGAGLKFGVGFAHDLGRVRPAADPERPNRVEVDTLAAYSTRGYYRGAAGLNFYHLGGAPLGLRVRAQHYEYPEEDFFGFGQDSLEDNRTSYLLRSTEGSAALQWKPGRLIDLGGGLSYLRPEIGSGKDPRFPSAEELFNPILLPGFSQQPDFLRSDASAALDWRDNPLHPHAGGRYGVEYSDYRDQDLDAYDFRKVSVELQQYVPIPDRYRIVALRAAAVFTDPRSGQQVPFYYQPTLGGAKALRASASSAFRIATPSS
jgi:hypothetical protein